jgi:ketosteroid isomerase-like protein
MNNDLTSDEQALMKTLLEYVNYMNTGDFEKWLSLWNEEAVQMQPYVPALVGVEKIGKAMRQVFEKNKIEIYIKEINEVIVHHDMGLTRLDYTLTLVDRNGKRIPLYPEGKTLTIWSRQKDGSWKITHDCSNLSTRRRIGT